MKLWQLSLLSLANALALISGCSTGSGGSQSNPPPASANAFSGQYAFVLSGLDPAGNAMGVAGGITADGLGHIAGGSVDVNDNRVISSSSALAGTYTLDSNSRGIITLTNMVGSVTHPLAFAFTLKADSTAGNMIGVDANNFVISGTIPKQDAAGFSLAQLAGDYTFELSSRALSQSTLLGRFTLGQSGASTNVVFDLSVSGFGATGPIMGGPVTATFAAAGPNGSGRGTLTLTDNSSVTENFVYYVVAAGTFIAIEIEPPVPCKQCSRVLRTSRTSLSHHRL